MKQNAHRRAGARTLGALVLLFALAGMAPSAQGGEAIVRVQRPQYDAARHSLVLDISGPVTISTRSLKAPVRLVVDVPGATLMSPNRDLRVEDGLVRRVRLSQFQILPPTVRVVIEPSTENEPLIAVQQTANKLYITLAPARAAAHDEHDENGGETSDDSEPEPAASRRPTPAPTGRAPQPARASARPAPSAAPPLSNPARPTPAPKPTPASARPAATPQPASQATPQSAKTPQPSPSAVVARTPSPTPIPPGPAAAKASPAAPARTPVPSRSSAPAPAQPASAPSAGAKGGGETARETLPGLN